ncbi:putative immunoglobulin-blocking virulence protein [Mesomycoplasma ovipneumoniae]|uniref:putative immunoglobulin-blocking virulence protein n=1 Tax=Mesomycoplasma ovipneumoniae TaxID=29562 RepID=UPI0028A86521|nr:putative immunoglobulin-blocking virulence protein [Mesomycoplasma ovipneumoniae]WNM13897.1 putative immunoglobulin-blocking virulence protein [Mesomycoplasma ovipneumoniae]
MRLSILPRVSKRKQTILLVTTPALIATLAIGFTQQLNPYTGEIPRPQIVFSPQDRNEVLKEPEKPAQTEIAKPEVTKIDVPKPVQPAEVETPKPEPKPVTSTPKKAIIAPINQPRVEPRPIPREEPKVISPSQTQVNSNLERLKAIALARYSQAIDNSIKEAKAKIAGFQQEIDEINRIYDNHFDDPRYNRDLKSTKAEWENFRIQKLRTFIGSNAPEYQLERTQSDLKILEQLKQTKKSFNQEEIKMLLRGMLPSVDSPYVWGYENESDNPVLNRLKEANKKRLINIPSWVSRTPGTISDLSYEGWDRSDISSQFSGIDNSLGNSVKVYNYTPNDKNEDRANRQPLKVIVLDANDNDAFKKFQEILTKVIQKDNKIQAVVLKNVGDKNSNQNVENILSSIPSSIKKLTLFLDNYNATANLRPLEKIKLDELELYSNIDALSDNWSINPNALKNIDYISFDYNNAATFHKNHPGEKIPGSIVFSTLAWDAHDTIQTVDEGLSIVFDSKVYQRIFQGSHGGKGGRPVNLDFSRAKNIKSLKGLSLEKYDKIWNDHVKNWKEDPYANDDFTGFRPIKFKKLIFGLDETNNFVAKWDDFNGGQLSSRLTFDEPGGAQIEFRDNSGVQTSSPIAIFLSGTPSGDAITEISAFIRAANSRNLLVNHLYVENESVLQQVGSRIGFVQVSVKNAGQNTVESGFLGEV